MKKITISIVSHGHGEMIGQLLDQLAMVSTHIDSIIITHNIQEGKNTVAVDYPFNVVCLINEVPLGFGANHNQAFQYCETDFFCVMNPDIHIQEEPFQSLMDTLHDPSVSIVAPLIKNLDGDVDDSARYFPTPIRLLRKVLLSDKGVYKFSIEDKCVSPDWVGGMFMLLPVEKFKELQGFDENYFLYYEDVDLCIRSRKLGYVVMLNTEVTVIHDARRDSHINLKYLRWHLTSAARFFLKHLGRFPNGH